MSPAHQKDSDALSDQNGVKQEILMPPGHETYHEDGVKLQKLSTDPNYRHKYVTTLVIYTLLLHLGALYGLYLILTLQLKFLTFVWSKYLIRNYSSRKDVISQKCLQLIRPVFFFKVRFWYF